MHTLHRFSILIASLLIFVSCKKTNMQGRLIPKTASIVVQVDGGSLLNKLPWATIKENPLFKDAYKDSTLPESIKRILDNPENAGIDIKKDLIFFIQKDSMGGYIGFEGTIKDEAAFKNFNNSFPEKGNASESNGIQYLTHSPVAVGWNKEKFVYLADAPQLGQMDELSRRMKRDSIDISSRSVRDIFATCKAVFALTENNSLGNEEKFTNLLAEKGDVHLWINTQELSTGAGTPSALAMLNLEKWYNDSRTTATINFDNGKININSHSYTGDEISKVFKKYKGGRINEDMIKRLPGKDIAALIALNFNPEGLKELLKTFNLDGFVNIGLTSFGIGMDDFIKANKGDLLIAITDLKMKSDTAKSNSEDALKLSGISQKPGFNFIFVTSIADKNAFNKLSNAGKKMSDKFFNDSNLPLAYNSNSNYFVLSNTKENTDNYLAGDNNNLDFISKISGEPFGGFINLQSIIKTFENEASKDSASKIMYDASIQMWDNIIWKGGDFRNDAINQTFEINLKDKSTNSLTQLNQYANKISISYHGKMKKQREDIMAFEDSEIPAELKENQHSPALPIAKEK